MEKNNDVGEQIRLARVTSGLTQKEFADKVEISRTYLGQLEKGTRKPSFDLLEKLSELVPALRRRQPVDFAVIQAQLDALPAEWHQAQAAKYEATMSRLRATTNEQMRLDLIGKVQSMVVELSFNDVVKIYVDMLDMLGIAPETDTEDMP